MSEIANDTIQSAPEKRKFFTKDVVMCVVVLVAIALVAGVLLGVVNWLTYVDADAAIISSVAEYYGVSESEVTSSPERVIVADGSSSYVSGCYTVTLTADGTSESVYVYHTVGSGAKDGTLELLVHVDENGIILDIEEYSQSETAGYFKKVMNANKQKYIGFDITTISAFDLVRKQSNVESAEDIAAVSGATYTSTGVNNAINAVVYAFNSYAGGEA